MVFSEQARVFEWIKGTKDDKGNKISKSKWEEKYFGKVSTDNFNIL